MAVSRSLVWVRLILMAGAVTTLIRPPAFAQQSTSREKRSEEAPLKPGDIDAEKSRVYVLVGKKGLGHEHGVEGRIKSGSIRLNADKDPGTIEFDMESFLADTDEARKYVELKGNVSESTRDRVTKAMLGPDVLDVEEFPTARFKIKSRQLIKSKKDGDSVVLKGEFTLHGKEQPLSVTAKIEKASGRSHLSGSFTILQSDFGITPYKAAFGAVAVTDELKIFGDLWIAESDR